MLHYNRYVLYPEMLRRAQKLIEILGLTLADRILIVGCGFGWTAEALAGMGYTVVGTDVSAYIQGNKTLSEDSDINTAITAVGLSPTSGEGLSHFNRLKGDGTRTRASVLNEDSSTASSRNRVKNILGTPTIAITEDLVTSLTDAECAVLQTNIVKYSGTMRVCHFVTEFANSAPPFNFNSKSLEDWKLLFPTAILIADGTFRVL
jgi:SAM-dependent methyltransferase